MILVEKTDPQTGDVSSVCLNPAEQIIFVVADARARERSRAGIHEFCRVAGGCRATIMTQHEHDTAKQRAQR